LEGRPSSTTAHQVAVLEGPIWPFLGEADALPEVLVGEAGDHLGHLRVVGRGRGPTAAWTYQNPKASIRRRGHHHDPHSTLDPDDRVARFLVDTLFASLTP
jgi:hypothetical protein